MRLPSDIEPVYFDEVYRLKPEWWREAISEICAAHGLPHEPFATFGEGSNLLAAVGERAVVKVFPPFHRHQWESECRTLTRLRGSIAFAVPELLASGERADGFTYAVISLLRGRTLEHAWSEIEEDDRLAIVRKIGEVMAEVHRVPVGPLVDLPPRWEPFLRAQVEGSFARHTRLSAPPWLLRELPAYLEAHAHLLCFESPHVILTGEYTPFNLMVEQGACGPRLCGMIDFGDTMVGPPLYDLLGPLSFLCSGRSERVRALLLGYGYAPEALNDTLRTRLMLLLLLHRYSNLKFQVRIAGWETRASSLTDLAELLFPFDP